MKKIYKKPETEVMHLGVQLLNATSPGVTIGEGEVEAGDVEVKEQRQGDYNVWDDDWSR
ncbi:MAG: hypothetical protein IJJ94_05190 [Bacteroidaceae bacterium]|nr:hypothetical protein [Bacteroidaceae bacterium]